MKRSSSRLSSPPSPPPLAPLPLSFSSSSLTCCPELNLSVTLSPSKVNMEPCPLNRSQQRNHSEQKPRSRGQTKRRENKEVCFEDPLVVTVRPEPGITLSKDNLPQQPIRSQRRSRGRHHAPGQCVELPAAASNQDPDCLERVELNTALAMKAELQSLQGSQFNSQKAIQEILQRSERTKYLINTRATEEVNVSRCQLLFSSLVSVDVQVDQLISQVLQDRLQLAPTPRCHENKAADGPSLFLFMGCDLLRQKPLPPEEEPVNMDPRPLTHHAHSTFDLYRRQRRCEVTP
ncbi:protein phosphatase 1 regulatory subunit 35 [Sparus aurata]|uniref:protein phosphatase 1 regulatory subunit 35 n=1 Tax=Sparus aurata TaxID=8175 RepID=UPI0011C192BB|nr:protein phosphatase 1 regulatory subunit 35-like [Sparus aurata]XP_030266103.1 protein phosphatase 1 regulatory subunit 35-like [Sparus aurata]XP_030266104.1 protein phosphatase 1 regulatory subunit 35-like [Sparus aurata]XP_030266106.1 protein phosphatase 1 regulatory subunit 35-like [Sparus aurata]